MSFDVQTEIKKEIERRKLGKDMLDFKRKQEEEKTKRILEERNREKAEEKAARERVKQQIAQVNHFCWFLHLTFRTRRVFFPFMSYLFACLKPETKCNGPHFLFFF